MISLLSMAVNAVTGLFVSVLKAVFSMLTWFVRSFIRILKLLYCIFPITAVAFLIFMVLNVFLLAQPDVLSPMGKMPLPSGVEGSFHPDVSVLGKLFDALKNWWVMSISPYRGSAVYVLLLILSIVMFVPVASILLAMSVFISYGNYLFIAIIVDVILYLLRGLLGTNFFEQAFDRYYKLFPDAGRRHYEKDYDKWLRKHHKEFRDSSFESDDKNSFYEDDEEYDRDEDDDYYEDDEDEEEDYYEDKDYDDEDYEDDEEYYEDDEEYEDDEDYVEEKVSASSGGFDFFAGCSTRESLDKKYKSLVKLYHPDNMDGDTAALQEINVQYDKAKKRFG